MKSHRYFRFVVLLWLLSMADSWAQNPIPPLDAADIIDLPAAHQLLADAILLYDSAHYEQALIPSKQALDWFQQKGHEEAYVASALQTGRSLFKLNRFQEAETVLKAAAQVATTLHPDGSLLRAKVHLELGCTYYKLDDANQAINEGLKALATPVDSLPEYTTQRVDALRLVGNAYFGIGQNHTAIPYLESAIKTARICYGGDNEKIAKMLVRLGVSHDYTGSYEQAINTLEQALAIQQKTLPPNHPDIASSFIALGACQESLKKYDDALFYLNQALDINLKHYGDTNSIIAYCYSQIGLVYMGKQDFGKALEYFQLESDLMIANHAEMDPAYAYTCNDLGQAYFALGNYPAAIQWQKKALALLRSAYKTDNQDIATVLYYIGRAQSAAGDYTAAIRSFEEDQRIMKGLFGFDSPFLYHSDAQMAYTYNEWHQKTGIDSLLEKSRSHFVLAEKAIEKHIQSETSAHTQQKMLVEAVPIFEKAIATEIRWGKGQNNLSALKKCWQLSESMHSYLLFAAAQEANARHFAGIPDDLLSKDSLLRMEITQLEKKRQSLIEQQGLGLSDSLVLAQNAKIYTKKEDARSLTAFFEKHYPDYFKLKFDLQTASLEQTQQLLTPQQTLLEYFTGDSTIFVFVVHHNDARLIELPRNFPLKDWVKGLREGITGYHVSKVKKSGLYESTVRQYADYAQKLQVKLLAPITEFLTEELIIIPGDELTNIPFEALLTAAPQDLSNFNTYPFLLRNHTIQYAYSATMLLQMMKRNPKQEPSVKLLAFAPFFEGDTTELALRLSHEDAIRLGLTALPYSGEEVTRVIKRVGGQSQLLLGMMATKQQFLALASQYQVLHLATHGKANHLAGKFSFLAFSTTEGTPENGLISVGELYNCSLNANLVVLSACETGIGEEQRGEGVVCLARAFTYAGAKSIVASLWSVTDKSTMQVMDEFYAALMDGKSKNVALSQAKLQYLEQHPGAASHPFFWAGFVAVGDMGKIKN